MCPAVWTYQPWVRLKRKLPSLAGIAPSIRTPPNPLNLILGSGKFHVYTHNFNQILGSLACRTNVMYLE